MSGHKEGKGKCGKHSFVGSKQEHCRLLLKQEFERHGIAFSLDDAVVLVVLGGDTADAPKEVQDVIRWVTNRVYWQPRMRTGRVTVPKPRGFTRRAFTQQEPSILTDVSPEESERDLLVALRCAREKQLKSRHFSRGRISRAITRIKTRERKRRLPGFVRSLVVSPKGRPNKLL